MKAKHETYVAQARRHAAGLALLARNKSDLQQTIEATRAARRIPLFGSPLMPGKGVDKKDFLTPTYDGDDSEASDVFGTTARASTNLEVASRDLDNSPEHRLFVKHSLRQTMPATKLKPSSNDSPMLRDRSIP